MGGGSGARFLDDVRRIDPDDVVDVVVIVVEGDDFVPKVACRHDATGIIEIEGRRLNYLTNPAQSSYPDSSASGRSDSSVSGSSE